MPFSLASICTQENWKTQEKANTSFSSTEPSSVLHMRRSPSRSPPTSASTLSSSFAGKKDEWANELQPILGGPPDRCSSGGLALPDWDSMWPDSSSGPPAATDHSSLLRWIAGGEVDDSYFGLKQLLQNGNCDGCETNPLEFGGNAGIGIVDHQGSVLDPIGNLIPGPGYDSSGSGFNGKVGKIDSISAAVGTNTDSSVLGFHSGNYYIQDAIFSNPSTQSSFPSGLIYQPHQQQNQFVEEAPEEKPQVVHNPQLLMTQHSQNPSFFMPLPYGNPEQQSLQPPPKKLNSGGGGLDSLSTQIPKLPISDPGHEFVLKKPDEHLNVGARSGLASYQGTVQFLPHQLQQQQHHTLLDQLYEAAELIGTGNFSHAQGILARLNHQLSPVGKPLHRAAYYFKEALQLLLFMNNINSPVPRTPAPFDVIFKMGAYKVFSEVSPLIQFVNFTSNQAFLEALDNADRIHIVDFDIGFGAQWASFIQELPLRSKGAPALKITAFASPSTHHPIELCLVRENLNQFASEVGVSLELEIVNSDCLEQAPYALPTVRSSANGAVAVNLPISSFSNQPFRLPSLLRFVKQLSPKIVVCLDQGCDRTDLPIPQHILHALQSYVNLLESLDAANVNSDAVNKIERFLLQPRIENNVLGRLRSPDKMPQWRTLLSSAGFSPVSFSNFTETQAEYVVKRSEARGFHVEKQQATLALCWQRRELISASAWRC